MKNQPTLGTTMGEKIRARANKLTKEDRARALQVARQFFRVEEYPPKQIGPYIISTRPKMKRPAQNVPQPPHWHEQDRP